MPAILAFALDGVLQAATVLPQIDPLAESIQGIGKQQLLAIIQRPDGRLQRFELLLQCLPATDVRVLVFEPLPGGDEQRREPVHQLRRAPLERVERVIQVVDQRQQMNHSPAQFLGIAHGLRAGAFMGQLADHQFQGVERGDHR
ncbi:hypothetical protein D3C73_781390 [compost metagenome]